MRVSVLSYSFRGLLKAGKMDVFGYLETCKYRYGLSAADIWNGFLVSTDDEYIQKVRDGLDERELELADLCVDQAHVWDNDESVREQNYQNALAALRAASILGARFVRIDAENAEADRLVAPWVAHTHFPWNITEGPLEDRMAALRDAGYSGYYSVEHHSAKNEYSEVAVQISRVRDVLQHWREGSGAWIATRGISWAR